MYDLIASLIVFLISSLFLLKSSDIFVDSSEKIGLTFNIPHFFIGVLIIGFGTSLPELVTSLISISKGLYEIPFSNVVGSNISNLLLILGLAALFKPLTFKRRIINVELPFLFFSSFLLLIFSSNKLITSFEAILLLISFILYLFYIAKNKDNGSHKDVKEKTNYKDFLKLLLSLIIIYFSSEYVIYSLKSIAYYTNINLEIVSALLLALSTSLPELVTSFSILKNSKSYDMVIGNIIGSNIINSFLIVSLSTLFAKYLIISEKMLFATFYLFLISLLFVFITQDNKIKREESYILLVLYSIYVFYLLDDKLF